MLCDATRQTSIHVYLFWAVYFDACHVADNTMLQILISRL
jgi:hypothetical protein